MNYIFSGISAMMPLLDTCSSITRIDRNIWISGYKAAADPESIQERGITRIVKMFADSTPTLGAITGTPGSNTW